jgi:hypothetical protein
MNVESDDPVHVTQRQLLPLFHELERILARDQDGDASAFFGEIRRWIECAVRTEDLMGPFMQLATTAFRGFDFAPDAHAVVDRILEAAQTLSFTLSAEQKISH